MFGFENGMNVVRTQREGNLRVDQTRWFRLDIDLNYPLPGRNMAPNDLSSPAPSLNPEAEGGLQIQKQSTRDVEVIDNEVRKKPRRDNDAVKEYMVSTQANMNNSQRASATDLPQQALIYRCPICMDNLREATSTKCGHIFCKECIEKALTFRKKCPTCRKRFRGKATFRVYLPTVN